MKIKACNNRKVYTINQIPQNISKNVKIIYFQNKIAYCIKGTPIIEVQYIIL